MGEWHYIALDLGGTNLKYALGDGQGSVVVKRSRPTEAARGRETVLNNMAGAIEELLAVAKRKRLSVRAVAIGSGGIIDVQRGIVVNATPNLPNWTGLDLRGRFEARLGLPVFVDNDANLMALAEAKFGAGVGAAKVFCLTVGTGIGGALVIDGELYRSPHCVAGEIGHTIIEADGVACNCGSRGCLEAYAAAPAIVARARDYRKQYPRSALAKIPPSSLSAKRVFEAASSGDLLARRVVRETCDYLGAAIANVVNLLGPDRVVIGGGVADAGTAFIRQVGRAAKERMLSAARPYVKIVGARLGNDAGIMGALYWARSCGPQ